MGFSVIVVQRIQHWAFLSSLAFLGSVSFGCFEDFDSFERVYVCEDSAECSTGWLCVGANPDAELAGQCAFDCSRNPDLCPPGFECRDSSTEGVAVCERVVVDGSDESDGSFGADEGSNDVEAAGLDRGVVPIDCSSPSEECGMPPTGTPPSDGGAAVGDALIGDALTTDGQMDGQDMDTTGSMADAMVVPPTCAQVCNEYCSAIAGCGLPCFPEFCEAECEAEDGLTIDDIQSESAGLATADCPQPLDTDFGGGNTTLMMTAYPVIGAHCTGLCTNLTAVLTGQLDTAQSDTLGNLCG